MRSPFLVFVALCACLVAVTAQAAPDAVGQSPGHLLRLVVGLALVLAAVAGLAWVLRRVGGVGGGRNGLVRVIGSAPVGQRERVVLVEVGSEQVVVGVAPGSVRPLHVLAEPVEHRQAEPGPEGGNGPAGFAAQLHAVMRGRRS